MLQLDKYGIIPNTTVNFWFDRDDFACALAQKLGQLKEYKVKETEFVMEVPENISSVQYYRFDGSGHVETLDAETVQKMTEDGLSDVYTYSLSDDIFPYAIGFAAPQTFETEILTGRFAVTIEPYEVGKEYTVVCEVVEHDEVDIRIPTNIYTANSFKRRITNDDFVETMLFLTYRVEKIPVGDG